MGGANPDAMSPGRTPFLLRGRAQASVAFLHEEAPHLDGAAQLAAADEALVEHVFHDFEQYTRLCPVQQRQVLIQRALEEHALDRREAVIVYLRDVLRHHDFVESAQPSTAAHCLE